MLRGPDGKMVDVADAAALAIAWQAAHDAHESANAAAKAAGVARAVHPRSMADLIARYRASVEFAEKAPATRADYEKALRPLLADFGHLPVAGLQRHHVAQVRDRYAWRQVPPAKGAVDGKPERVRNARQANRVITMLSILCTFACDNLGWRSDNPALRPKRLKSKTDGYRAWLPAEWEQFCARADADWQFAAILALLTAQRGQDQVAMAWADYDGARLRVVQEKSGGRVKLWLPCHDALRAALDARHADLSRLAAERGSAMPSTLLTRPDGLPWAPNAFQKAAGAAIRAAGLSGVVWHGLRGTALSWAAEGGASELALMGLSGHRTAATAQHYARGAAQERMAGAAILAITLPAPRGQHGGAQSIAAAPRTAIHGADRVPSTPPETG